MSEAAIRSGSGSRGGEERRPARKRPARSGSRARPAARRSPGRPSSSARHTCRPMAPSPTTPTFRVFCMMAGDDIMRASARMRRASALREPLERLYREFDYAVRVERDALRFPLRYHEPHDREVVALLSASLAYGRVDLFSRGLELILDAMGRSPAAFVADFDVRRDAPAFESFIYRFNRPRDIAAFCLAARQILERHGTLEKCFVAGDPDGRGRRDTTAGLAPIDPADPVKYDFALCHTRMAGDCRDRRDPVVCPPCGLRAVCRHWSRRRD